MHASNTVHIDSHAAATLRYIRASMEAAASVAVPGSAAIAAGIVGVLAALVSSISGLREYWLIIWLIAAFIAAGLGSVLLLRQSPLDALTIAGSPVRKFALCLLPSLFAGAVMTGVLWSHGTVQAIPGTWLILYGCALIAASAVAAQIMGLVGGLFVVAGLLALLIPRELQTFVLGLGFGGLHLLLGFMIGRAGRGGEI
jgi:hypothetical protein